MVFEQRNHFLLLVILAFGRRAHSQRARSLSVLVCKPSLSIKEKASEAQSFSSHSKHTQQQKRKKENVRLDFSRHPRKIKI